MKKKFLTLIALLFFVSFVSAQFTKVETFEPIQEKTLLNKKGEVIASIERHVEGYIAVQFHDTHSNKLMTFNLTPTEYNQMRQILNDYTIEDKAFYMLEIVNGRIYIRFVEKFNYVQSNIYMHLGGQIRYFPKMNRYEYTKLFPPLVD